MTSFDTLRPWEGEQSRAFEELSFQLLKDKVLAGTKAIRTGNPDGGVEWYAVLPDGTEHGWQAKHVHGIDALLTAMTGSVERVAKERPALRTLTFVVSWNLATSRQIRRTTGQLKSQRDKFNDKVDTWKQKIPGADKITFELIQGSDLLDELAKPQHEGRRWFWWGETVLGRDWLRAHYDLQASAAGEKYRPDLQVDIPIQEDLLALGVDASVLKHLRRLVREVVAGVAEAQRWPPSTPGPLYSAAARAASKLGETASAFDLQAGDPADVLDHLHNLLDESQRAVDALIEDEHAAEAARHDRATDTTGSERPAGEIRHSSDFRDLIRAAHELSVWLSSSPGRALRQRTYFLAGEAGSGKTHLLLDATQRALDNDRPAVFLAGAQLGRSGMWTSICDQLGLENLGGDVLLKAMDTAGEAAAKSGSRFLLIIDALNETVPSDFWWVHLPALRAKVAQYPHVALAVSCRDTYQDLVLNQTERAHFHRRTHPGFAGREIEATHAYFQMFGLQAPKIPLLTPEFTLPLFLRMYCESISYTGPASGHEGHQGRVTIFDQYLAAKVSAIARRLTPGAASSYERDAARTRVGTVLNALLDEMARLGREGLSASEAETVVQRALEAAPLAPARLLGLLQDEGVLTRERLYLGEDTFGDGVRIVFQTFADFLLLKRRLAASTDPQTDPALKLWLDQEASWGIVEAATILFPEVYGIELPDLLNIGGPRTVRDNSGGKQQIGVQQLYRSLARMVPYRASGAVTERTIELINRAIPDFPADDVYRMLFTVAPQPGNLLNAERLHDNLNRLRMPERDTIFGFATYHELADDGSPTARLARWAAAGPYPGYDPKVIELACIPLCWLLSSPNRFMRDWITKALVQVLRGHLDVMRALIERFWSVDDPYVVQRVVAIAYGCLLRSTSAQATEAATLADAVHTRVFTHPVRADELLLDAARGITRWAVGRQLLPASASAAAERPYGLSAPSAPPTQATLDAKYGRHDDLSPDENYLSIFVSVLNMGDFGRYVIESGLRHFSRHRIGQPYPDRQQGRTAPRFIKARWRTFVASLTEQQKTKHAGWLRNPDPHRMSVLSYMRQRAQDPLTAEQRKLLDAVWSYPKFVSDDYPADQARRWVFRRTLQLGWTPKRFRAEDQRVGHGRGREGHKAERWGKKYQWIAYHELLARVADNYQSNRLYDDSPPYDGLHRLIGKREIDPSLPPIDFRAFSDDDGLDATAWQPPVIGLAVWPPANLDFRRYRGDIQRLLADTESEPTIRNSVFVKDADSTDWIVLDGFINKIDPAAHKGWRGLQESSWVDTLLIAAADADRFVTVLSQQSRHKVLDLIDSHGHVDCCYVGEVGRTGPPCYNRHPDFEAVEVQGHQFTVGHTVEPYAWEGNILDCSIGDTARTLLPSTLIQQAVDLTFDMRGPSWLDATGSPMFTFYHRQGNSSRALLVRGSFMREFLAERGLELIILHGFERMELTDKRDGPFPSINASVEARLTADLTVHTSQSRREERHVTHP
ncbi:hypothetical protein ACIBVK_29195 [Micromonospora echinofusca]|uniref:hypothetical protein n=1 Tax=Micromonospora echinofusca TaxID=47858 RepID=UPI0037A587BD